MSAKEPNDPFDLSQLSDLDSLDLGSPSKGDDLDLPDLEPFTEAAAENNAKLPELPDQVELNRKPVGSPAPIDDLPPLPEEALVQPARKPATPPKPAARKPATAPKVAKPKATAAKPKPVAKPKPIAKAKPVAKPIQKVARKPAAPAAVVEPKESAAQAPEKATIEPAAAAAAVSPELAGERKPDLTPLHLRKAAWIVLLGSLLPWMGSGAGWVTFIAAKLTICLGAWVLFQTVRHGAKEKVPGLIAKLAAVNWAKPDSGKRNKPMSEVLLGTIPSLGHVIGLVALLGGVAVTVFDPAYSKDGSLLKGLAEVGMLAWAASTMVHIFAYTHGGKFNPIFPLMFIGMVFAGLLSLIGAFFVTNTLLLVSGVLGSLTVASGGVFACYTMFEAMKQAKVEGEAKKAAAREARKQARAQGGGQSGARGKVAGKPAVAPKQTPKSDSDKS